MTTKGPKKTVATKPRVTVAEYLSAQIDLCGKSQLELARSAGFEKPNIITMLKQGKTKLPIGRVGAMAAALNVDPLHLFALAMAEYQPDTWDTIQTFVLKQPFVTANEMEIVELVRASGITNPKLRTQEERERLAAAIAKLRPDNAVAGD